MPANSEAAALLARIRAEVPHAPGVYVFRDASGIPLYVGKSVDLRKRMTSHLAPSRSAPDSRSRYLAVAIRAFAFTETPGELAALLLEDALIKRLNPRANTRQRDYLERAYLLLTDAAYPTLRVVDGDPPFHGEVFGPFRDRYFAADLLAIVHRHFRLRACVDDEPFRRSANYDLGLCTGPCRGAISPGAYAPIAGRVRGFLRGDDAWITTELERSIEDASARLAFEEAGALLETLAFCRRFTRRQRFIETFRAGPMEVTDAADAASVYRFERGALKVLTVRGRSVPIPAELSEPVGDARFLLDRAHLVYDWVNAHPPAADLAAPKASLPASHMHA